MVNRYYTNAKDSETFAGPDGPFVLYADYEKLEAALAAVQATSIAHAGEQNARIAQLEAAIRWALGEEGEFPDEPEPQGKYRRKYYWRAELRKRARLDSLSTLCAVCDQIKELHPKSHEWTSKPQHDPGCNSWGQMMYAGHYPCSCGLSK